MFISLLLRRLGRCLRTGAVPLSDRDPGSFYLVALLCVTFPTWSRIVASTFWEAMWKKGHRSSYIPTISEVAMEASPYISMAACHGHMVIWPHTLLLGGPKHAAFILSTRVPSPKLELHQHAKMPMSIHPTLHYSVPGTVPS